MVSEISELTTAHGMNQTADVAPFYGKSTYILQGKEQFSKDLMLQWQLHQGPNREIVVSGRVNFTDLAYRLAELAKLERQLQERVAAVWLDDVAPKLLSALDRETSIRWDDLPAKAGSDWYRASRGAAILVGANLCEVSPTRIRLTEQGDRYLSSQSLTDEVVIDVAN